MENDAANNKILVLNREETSRIFSLEVAITAVDDAYRAHATGSGRLFPVVRERIEGGVCGIKSGYWPAASAIGLKVAGSWSGNHARGLATHQATVVLCDAATGRLRALIDGNVITTQRTAAAGAVALRALARPNARTVAILGAGVQAFAQAMAARHVFPDLQQICIWARHHGRAEQLAVRLRANGLDVVVAADATSAVRGRDIVVTTTPSTEPLVSRDAVGPGAHINAMGSDTQGKRELSPDLVMSATLVVDDRDQARTLGESQPPVEWGHVPATIGEVLTGRRSGRTDDAEITVFDSSGLGLQDVMAAAHIYKHACDTGAGLWVEWGQEQGDAADVLTRGEHTRDG